MIMQLRMELQLLQNQMCLYIRNRKKWKHGGLSLAVIGSFFVPANEKRTSVDRLLWIISKEVYFLCFLIRRDTRHESHRFRILKRKTIQNSEDIINEKL